PRPPAPRPPLFPYTTLFRSVHPATSGSVRGSFNFVAIEPLRSRGKILVTACKDYGRRREAKHPRDRPQDQMVDGKKPKPNAWPEDRKSTRLNSSHDQISYAV